MSKCLRLAVIASIFAATPAVAQDVELPYWASIDTEVANMRVGAGEQFPIEWVYTREGLPVKVIRLMQGWRYVQEPDGTTGWISASLLSRERTAIVTGDGLAPMRAEPGDGSALKWNLEPGVLGLLGDCQDGWCELDVDGHAGWVEQRRLWGAGEP
ncbi:SH3 domain-containing protein [Aurantiacibacter sp. MUD11]|uniref:SH3 domain-containing protein n=1 Tax=Aurantiacibacter sp. MUD11 TaxID=3003265 RepID=UPI0022AA2C4F|nr:SH3 domain-containing protein [Aurantiacibacter sp. MUD11]WAT18482.1 SH3 domain-containing protein [Aurantiacibacter sp. MUD11]